METVWVKYDEHHFINEWNRCDMTEDSSYQAIEAETTLIGLLECIYVSDGRAVVDSERQQQLKVHQEQINRENSASLPQVLLLMSQLSIRLFNIEQELMKLKEGD